MEHQTESIQHKTMRTIGIDIRLLGKQRTGDEAVFFNLTREVLRLDTENTYRLYTDERDEQKLAALRGRLGAVGNSRVEFVTLWSPNRFFWNLVALPWSLWRRPAHVYHTQYIAPFFLPRRVKLVTHIHDVSFRAHPEWIGFWDRLFLSLLIPRSLRRSAAIVAPSQFTLDEIVRFYGVSREKLSLVPNAIGPEWERPITSADRERVRTKYGLPARYFVALGTMQPRKNIAFLIRAFRRFRETHPEYSLVLVGNTAGHHVDRLVTMSQATGEPGLIFPGYVGEHDVPTLLVMSRGLVFPSLYEGFGIPMLEAWAVGVPVLAADIPSLREVAGDSVLFFSPIDLATVEKALYTLSVDEKKGLALSDKGRERLRIFSWADSARRLLAVYWSV